MSSNASPDAADQQADPGRRWGDARARLSGPERREQLLEVAGDMFGTHGYHGLSMEQLAEGAGVSKPVLYQHFPSKRALYLAVIRAALAEMERVVRSALEGTADNRERIAGAIGAFFDVVHNRRFQVLVGAGELADDAVRAEVEGSTRRLAATVGNLIATDAGLSDDAAQFLASAVQGLAMEGARWWIEHPAMDRDEAVQLLSRLVWRGLGSFGPDQQGRHEEDEALVRPVGRGVGRSA